MVGGFIGSPPMNFIKGAIIKKDGKLHFNEGVFHVRIIDAMAQKLNQYVNKEITFGIRPEDIYDKLFVSSAPPENTIRAACEVVEPMGAEVYLHLNTGKNTMIAKVGGHDRPEVNQDMDLVFDMSKVHFFDKNTDNIII